jgi:hypothetical protein
MTILFLILSFRRVLLGYSPASEKLRRRGITHTKAYNNDNFNCDLFLGELLQQRNSITLIVSQSPVMGKDNHDHHNNYHHHHYDYTVLLLGNYCNSNLFLLRTNSFKYRSFLNRTSH